MKNTVIQSFKIGLFKVLISAVQATACDGCACAANSSLMSGMPLTTGDFVGAKYSLVSFKDPILDVRSNSGERIIEDQYHRFEVFGRVELSDHWFMTFGVPYQMHQRNYASGSSEDIEGVGDVNANFFRELFRVQERMREDSSAVVWGKFLQLGAGIKLPTGQYRQRNSNLTLLPQNFQIGSGAFSFNAGVNAGVTVNGYGIVGSVNYRYNTTNESFYSYGNQVVGSIDFYYRYKKEKFTFVPRLGFYHEYFEQDVSYSSLMVFSGGYAFFGRMAFDVQYKDFNLNLSYLLPQAYDFATDDMQPSNRWLASIAYLW